MRPPTVVTRPPQPLVHAGKGVAATILREHDRPGTLVLLDPAVVDRVAAPTRARVRHVAAPTDLDGVRELASDLTAWGINLILTFGGGNAMDLAALATAAALDPSLLDDLAEQAHRSGFVVPRSAPPPGLLPRLVVVPSTVGTGAEASSVACYAAILADGPAKVLVSLPELRPNVVCYDPELLRGPAWLVREGAFEVATRVLASAAESPSTLWRAELDAGHVLGALADLVDALLEPAEPTDATLLALATLSADSHGGWSLRGRGAAPSSLWFLATELSTATGLRKAQAMRSLLPAWLMELDAAGRGPSVAALCGALGVVGGTDEVNGWSEALVPRATLHRWDVDAVTDRVVRRFGRGRPMRRDVGPDLVRRVLASAEPAPVGA